MPEWAKAYTTKWIGRLRIKQWRIAIELRRHEDMGVDGARAQVRLNPLIMQAIIALDAKIPDDPDSEVTTEWKQDIVHELLHVLLGNMSTYVEEILLTELSPSAISVAAPSWTHQFEPVVEQLTQILIDLEREATPDAKIPCAGSQ